MQDLISEYIMYERLNGSEQLVAITVHPMATTVFRFQKLVQMIIPAQAGTTNITYAIWMPTRNDSRPTRFAEFRMHGIQHLLFQ